MTNLCIVTNPVANRQNCESFFDFLWLLEAFFYSLAVKGTVCKFSNTNFRSIDLFGRCVCNMFLYATTAMEILNPRVSIKEVAFHKLLIIKVNITVSGTAIITMFHHLIMLLSFGSLRPNARQTKKPGFAFFRCKFRRGLFGHNQLVCQPLSLTLRKRESLQVSP